MNKYEVIEFENWFTESITTEQILALTEHLSDEELAEAIMDCMLMSAFGVASNKLNELAKSMYDDLVADEDESVINWDYDFDEGYADYLRDQMKDDALTGDL